MNSNMNYPMPARQPAGHSQYDPFTWIFYVRCVQFVFTILVIGLAGYAASQSIFTSGPMLSFWTITWSIIYIPCTVFLIPRIPERYRPNIIVLVLECFSWFWWLLTFILLASFASIADWTAAAVSETYDEYATLTGIKYDTDYGNLVAAGGCTRAAAAFAALTYLSFKVTFIALCIRIHRQRKERLAEHFHHGVEAGAHGAAIEVNQINGDKMGMQAQAQEVRY